MNKTKKQTNRLVEGFHCTTKVNQKLTISLKEKTMATSNLNNGQPYYVDALLYPKETRWNARSPVGTPVNVTYSFMTSNPDNSKDANFVAFTQKQSEFFEQRLGEWGEFANITFTRINNGNKGQIRFGMKALEGQGLSGSPNPGGSTNTWIDKHWSTGFDTTPGRFLWSLGLHEMGHALGLDHPGPYNFGSKEADNAYSKSNNYMPKGEDNYQYSLMSYNDGLNGRVKYTGSEATALTPLLYDIATIQYLYGANAKTRTGTDTYSFNDPNKAVHQAIWDAGGIDTISAANQILPATIDLKAGAFSSIGPRADGSSTPATNNLAIAYAVAGINSTIENAIGGANDDKIYGNSANNILQGNGGGDYIDGWEGDDILYGGTSTNFINTGNDVLVAWKGNDLLYGGDGDDWLDGSYGDDKLYGGEGNDTLGNSVAPESGNDKMYGGSGNDAIYGGSGNDTLDGGDGNDSVDAGEGNDFVSGGLGDDSLIGNAGSDNLQGGDGNDVLYGDKEGSASSGQDLLYGGEGNDYLSGGNGNDLLVGGNGNDFLMGNNSGNATSDIDKLLGGSGADIFGLGYSGSYSTLNYTGSGYAVILDFNADLGDKIRLGSANSYTLKQLNLVGSAAQDTGIYSNGDLIAVVQDTVKISAANIY